MESIKLGYVYNSELEAIAARKLVSDYYGFPKKPDDITFYFVDYSYSLYDNFWYILWIEGCTEVLGEPYEFTIHYPDFSNE